jgi:predicted RNA binding protein YcfA (HicA-like mRNA interferase family)
MSTLPRITAAKLVRALRRAGFRFARQRGSHAIYEHADGRYATVPMHSGDLPLGTLQQILKSALTADELRRLL